MDNLAQIDRILSEINEPEKKEKTSDDFDDQQDEEVSIESAFGLWKDRDITKETLRKKAWVKN